MIIEIAEMKTMRQRPTQGSAGAAGFDLYCANGWAIDQGYINLLPNERFVFDTGVKMAIPKGYAGFIWPRSGLAVKQGLQIQGGLIDSDYRGEIKVCLYNGSTRRALIDTSKAIAQIVFQRHETPVFRSVSELPSSDRGEGRFGSTDRRTEGLADPFPAFDEVPR